MGLIAEADCIDENYKKGYSENTIRACADGLLRVGGVWMMLSGSNAGRKAMRRSINLLAYRCR